MIFSFGFFVRAVLATSFLYSLAASAQEMNGIKLDQYGDFTKKWKLVTVRFRKDTNEMRFTYANDKAYEALENGTHPLPEGSVLAKVGFKSGIDPAFNSSVVPSGARRFQFMVKNSELYKDTDGWGYALFTSEGQLFENGDVKTQTIACHTCHKLVPERDFVFSERIEFSPFIKKLANTYEISKNSSHLRFVEFKPVSITLRKYLKKAKIGKLKIIDGDLRTYFFAGTLDEITPLLINQILNENLPSVAVGFVSQDEKTYKIVSREPKKLCAAHEVGMRIYELRNLGETSNRKFEDQICYPVK